MNVTPRKCPVCGHINAQTNEAATMMRCGLCGTSDDVRRFPVVDITTMPIPEGAMQLQDLQRMAHLMGFTVIRKPDAVTHARIADVISHNATRFPEVSAETIATKVLSAMGFR